MSLELTVLGSGNYAPGRGRTVRNPSGYAVRAGEDVVLLDLGFGNARQLARAGIRADEVSDVLLTHSHPDHCGDIPALLFQLRYEAKPRRERLRVWGPAGVSALVSSLCRAWKPWLDPRGYALEVREIRGGDQIEGLGWVATAANARHTTPALCYRLQRDDASLVYTGDTEFDEGLARFARDCGLLVAECTGTAARPIPGHMDAARALELARLSNCRRALLTHLSDDSAAEAARLIKGRARVSLARDLLRKKI